MRINFELLDLRAFLAILEFGTFHRVAELLNVSQPALSRRIQRLEERLGTALFERTTRNITPTAAARQLEPIARRLLDELDSSILSISGVGEKQSGQITIASIPTAAHYLLPAFINQFKRQYPTIRLRVLDRTPQEALECVIRGEAEFGVNMIGSIETDIAFTHLLSDPYVLACHRGHPLAKKKTVAWRDLNGHDFIRIGRSNSGNRAVLDGALSKAQVDLTWRYEVNNLTTALGFVEAGLGASVLPRLAMPHTHPVIVTRRIHSPEVARSIGLVERRRGRLSSPAKSVRDMLLAGSEAAGARQAG